MCLPLHVCDSFCWWESGPQITEFFSWLEKKDDLRLKNSPQEMTEHTLTNKKNYGISYLLLDNEYTSIGRRTWWNWGEY